MLGNCPQELTNTQLSKQPFHLGYSDANGYSERGFWQSPCVRPTGSIPENVACRILSDYREDRARASYSLERSIF